MLLIERGMQILLSKGVTVWFKKKPVAVEVFIFNKDAEVMAPKWFLKAVQNEKIFIDRMLEDERSVVYGCTIHSQYGKLRAYIGDYILKGPSGEIWPCKKKMFKKLYESL